MSMSRTTTAGDYRVCKGRMIRVLAHRGDHITQEMVLVVEVLDVRPVWVRPSTLSEETYNELEVLAWVSR